MLMLGKGEGGFLAGFGGIKGLGNPTSPIDYMKANTIACISAVLVIKARFPSQR